MDPAVPHRRAAVWILGAIVAACARAATDVVTTLDVGSVSIRAPSTTVTVGSQISLEALVQDASGQAIAATDVFWSVQDPSIATISSDGIVTGVAPGSTQISASVNGKSGIAMITVEKTPVTSVVVTPPHVDAAPGVRTQLSAVAYDAAQNPLSGRAITWSTSNAAVATVDSNGMVSAVGTGAATITATAEGKSGTATITVSQAAVATVMVTPSPLSMSVGQTTQLTATLEDGVGNVLNGRTVSWSSSSPAAATVSSQGLVTAVAKGSATITATSEGKTGTADVTTTNVAVGSVTVQPQNQSIVVGSNAPLSAIVRDVNGNVVTDRAVTWASSTPAVATVAAGVVTGVNAGTATITATSEGKSGTSAITVVVPIATVTVAPATKTILAGDTAPFTATAKDAQGHVLAGQAFVWTSSSPGVATVSLTGTATGVGVGVTTITATASLGGKSGSATLTVNAASISVTPSPDSAYVGQTATLTATAKDKNGNPVPAPGFSWSSSAPGIATVSQSGVVSGVAAGSTTIVATLGGQSAQAAFKVLAPVATVTVSPSNPSIAKKGNVVLQATLKDASNNDIGPGRVVTWTASDNSIVTLSPTAGTYTVTVKAKSPGTVTITATSEGKTGTTTVTVKP
jgi:uncharacterized protein YjdB